MAPSKLSDADKRAVIDLYRQPGETTSTIGDRFGVSNSTISRVLKNNLPAEEYSRLIQQKRLGNETNSAETTPGAQPKSAVAAPTGIGSTAKADLPEPAVESPPSPTKARSKTRGTQGRAAQGKATKSDADDPPTLDNLDLEQLKLDDIELDDQEELDLDIGDLDISRRLPDLSAATQETPEAQSSGAKPPPKLKSKVTADEDGEGEEDEDEDYNAVALDDDDYDDDDEDEDEDDYDDEGDDSLDSPVLPKEAWVKILPLTSSVLPNGTCYIVVDRGTELVAPPLKEFSDLGQIPQAEMDAKTLPVFDNQRVAKRYIRGNQRVIKVPNGMVLQTTSSYLSAKGITRLLISGQVYSLV